MPTFKESEVNWDGTHFTFQVGVYQRLKKLFWDKDIDEEILKAERWLQFNPPKKRWGRFLCNWLNNSQKKMNFQERKTLNEMPGRGRNGDNHEPKAIDFNQSLNKLRGQK